MLTVCDTSRIPKIKPACALFGTCGGCKYQDIPYEDELVLKAGALRALLTDALEGLDPEVIESVVPSPDFYHYRNRLDLTLRKDRDGGWKMGFMLENTHRLEEVTACPIARHEINGFLPELRKEAVSKAEAGEYRNANLTVRVGEAGKVAWGGIGRRSLRMPQEDYFSVTLRGRRIFYSLDTFFQANLSILGKIVGHLADNIRWTRETVFLDLYSGVGLFGIALADLAKEIVMIESGHDSVRLARHNIEYHKLGHARILEGQVEQYLPEVLKETAGRDRVALIDPPRTGLCPSVIETLNAAEELASLFYLSCSPVSLARDLKKLTAGTWTVGKVTPFDFFPRTRHLETLVCLGRR
ncbi:MAG TPA: RsmD family RNA methyltransferase [Candidatus Omnitrophota bacterium]|jgi:23S rRNA (uracil1939-C5)-methyltransferase/tRNA (uracil-5-)-methyltransferase|nr:RsmD family RNA methyltransferase [Candidatus Omnitrophota bacterium]